MLGYFLRLLSLQNSKIIRIFQGEIMATTETFDEQEFKLSSKTGLYVPERMAFEVDHPYLSRALQVAAPVAAGALAGLLAIAPMVSYADTPSANPPVKPAHSLFVGSLVTGKAKGTSLDHIVDYHHNNGAQVTVESIETPLAEPQTHALSLGVKTPFLVDRVRLGAVVDSDVVFNTWGYTGLVEVVAMPNFIVRAGAMQSSKGVLGGFSGAQFVQNYLTVDFDLWGSSGQFGAQGYVAGVIPAGEKQVYVAVGGDLLKEQINLVAGLINPSGFGFFSRTQVDFLQKKQQGRVIMGSAFTFTRANFDFRSHILNNTEMRGVTTGYVLDGWAPLDGKATDGQNGHIAASLDWSNDEKLVRGNATLYLRALPSLMFGLGAGYGYNKVTGEHNPTLSGEIYAGIPGTPLDVWAQLQRNLRTGDIDAKGYVGLTTKF